MISIQGCQVISYSVFDRVDTTPTLLLSATEMALEGFEPLFGEAKAENGPRPPAGRFLFHVHSPDTSHLRIHVTDFKSNTWEAKRSVSQLEDMRDDIGIEGSWSDFVEYLTASIKSEDVKLVLDTNSNSQAKLVAQKSKGMPRVSISLSKLEGPAASDALANLSLGLFNTYKTAHHRLIKEEERACLLTQMIAAEKEKNENNEDQLKQHLKRPKLQHLNSSEKSDVSDHSISNDLLNSPDKQRARDPVSSKVANRVLPAYRRAKVRGAVLLDTEDDKDN